MSYGATLRLKTVLSKCTGAVLNLRPIKHAYEKARTKVEDKNASLNVTNDLIGYVKL